ncbi:adenosylcobinamide-GDP ribazoletransferase [Corynebacterium pelargi]|uniref:Adenosylcobinamide-GDP ribazoletransferase n=1 Tax=Corynebacterium pelargi TaxID=1471400 RepID=A0A410W7T0_9CORY|nr:adenosylcobinamide-GDP ribazoletransferase [Corynebacterium pelargi]QAU52001.1 Cobalamin synthase [Corynebacterium pelargi]GGG70886.1 adenosylcobinamide-GDP ribazoletransferase [Corynebacterium pelargi]
MSDKVDFVEGSHGPAIVEGPLTALSWLSILPIRGATAFDRITGARVITSVPFVGMVYGVIAALVAGVGIALEASPLLVGVLAVTAMELFGRFMHLDGLGDVADALGSYGSPAKAREVLADPHIGLIGAASGLLSLLAQTAAIGTLASTSWDIPLRLAAIAAGPAIGRLGVLFVCHKSCKPMKPTGFAAQIIGTIPTSRLLLWITSYAVVCVATLPFAPAFGLACLLALAVSCASAFVLSRHCHRRFEGLNGDCCGFVIHLCTTIALVVLALSY